MFKLLRVKYLTKTVYLTHPLYIFGLLLQKSVFDCNATRSIRNIPGHLMFSLEHFSTLRGTFIDLLESFKIKCLFV
jgi:hypothetical protein